MLNKHYIGLIVFCCAFGITIGTMGKRGEPMLHFFIILNEIVMKLIKLVMWYGNILNSFLEKQSIVNMYLGIHQLESRFWLQERF